MAAPKLTFTPGTSSSVMLTVVSEVVPAVTRSGRVPKPSLTDSPSSLSVSWIAENVTVFSVSPLAKVTLVGTPE